MKDLPFDWNVQLKMIVNQTIVSDWMNSNNRSKEIHSELISRICSKPSVENKFSFEETNPLQFPWICLDFLRDHFSYQSLIVQWQFSTVDRVHAENVHVHDWILRKSYENVEKQAIKQLEFFHWVDRSVD